MTTTVTLKNKTNRMLVLSMKHPQAPRRRHIHNQRVRNKKSGRVGVKAQHLGINEELILIAGEKREGLPPWVAEVPDVRRLENSALDVVIVNHDKEPAPPEEEKKKPSVSVDAGAKPPEVSAEAKEDLGTSDDKGSFIPSEKKSPAKGTKSSKKR